MQEPWEYFMDGIEQRLGGAATAHETEDYVRVRAIRDAAESLIAWLTGEQGWPWAAARILAARLVDRTFLSAFLNESPASLRTDLRLIWEAERGTCPDQEVWYHLMAPLEGTFAPRVSGPARPRDSVLT